MTTLKITGMTCDSCAVHVKEALEKVPGVQSADVSYTKGSAKLAVEAGSHQWLAGHFRRRALRSRRNKRVPKDAFPRQRPGRRFARCLRAA